MHLYQDNTGRSKVITKRKWWGKSYTAIVPDEHPKLLSREKIKTNERNSITEELVLKAALNIMSFRKDRDEAKSLVGKYPPKKIDAGF